jgi:hypothetical protein
MAQFYPMNQNSIPVAQPTTGRQQQYKSHLSPLPPLPTYNEEETTIPIKNSSGFQHSISKKASFFQKSNTIRKILSASTLR